MVVLSHPLKAFITFKIFSVFNIGMIFIIKECLKEFRYCQVVLEACVLKLSIFVIQKLALHQNGVFVMEKFLEQRHREKQTQSRTKQII